MRLFWLIFAQTLQLAFRKGGGAFGACAFYIIIVTIFTFALGVDGIQQHAGAVMCVAMLLAIITTLPLLFERDHEDGTLEQYTLQPVLFELVILAKLFGQWCSHILPILVVSPLLAIMAALSPEQTFDAMMLLLLASPTMVCIGGIGAALTLGSKRGGLLQALVIMPLYIPVLIFATSAGEGATLFLSGMLCAAIPLSAFLCANLVKLSQD